MTIVSNIRLAALLTIGLIGVALPFTGCGPRDHHETIGGVTVSVPARMKKLATSEERVNLGTQQKGEQVSFRGEMSRSEIARFYQNVLPAGGWKPDARLGSEIGGYVFTRGPETIAIRIVENDSSMSTLIVLGSSERLEAGKPG